MDGITTAAGILSALLTFTMECGEDLVKEKTIDIIPKLPKKILQALKNLETPINHDVERAAYIAQWLSTKLFTQHLQKIYKNKGANFNEPLVQVENVTNNFLSLLKKNSTINDNNLLETNDILILLTKNSFDKNDYEVFRKKLIDKHIVEIKNELSSGFWLNRQGFEIFENSLYEKLKFDNNKLDWFDLVCAFFNDLLKGDNNRAKDGFQNQLLSNISLHNQDIKLVVDQINNKIEQQFVENKIGIESFDLLKSTVSDSYIYFQKSLFRIEEKVDEIYSYVRGNYEKQNNNYIIKRGSEVSPDELLGNRSNELNGYDDSYYLRRQIDDELLHKIEENNNIILTGKPLSGKSRAILELIRTNYSKNLIVFPTGFGGINYTDFRSDLDNDQKLKKNLLNLIIFNDCEDAFLELGYKVLIQQILNERELNVKIIICFSSHRYSDLIRNLDDKLENFKTIRIDDLTDDEKSELKKKLNRTNEQFLSERIGAYFVDIESMRFLYEGKYLSDLSKAILRSYKVIGRWKLRRRNHLENIKLHTSYYYQPQIVSDREWEFALKQLVESGFISISKSDNFEPIKIYVDEAYEKDIIGFEAGINVLPEEVQVEEILRYYPNTTEMFNKLIDRVHNDKIRWSILDMMVAKKIQTNFFTFYNLYNHNKGELKTKKRNRIKNYLRESDQATKFNYSFFLINDSLENKLDFFSQKIRNSKTDSLTFYACTRDIKTFSDGWRYYKILKDQDIDIDRIWTQSLIAFFVTLPLGEISFNEIWDEFYMTIKNHLSTSIEDHWISFYITFLKKAPDFFWSKKIFDEIIYSDQNIVNSLFTNFLKKAESVDEVFLVRKITQTWHDNNGLMISDNFYNSIIAHPVIVDYDVINEVYNCIDQPDAFTYNALFTKKTLTNTQLWNYFENLLNLLNNRVIDKSLLSPSKHFAPLLVRDFKKENLLKIFDISLELSITPGYFFESVYNGIRIITDENLWDFTKLFLLKIDQKAFPVSKIYPALYTKILSRKLTLDQSIVVFQHSTKYGFKLRSPAINFVLKNAVSFGELNKIRDAIDLNDVSLNVAVIYQMLMLCKTDDQFQELLNWINVLNINFKLNLTDKLKFDFILCKKFVEVTSGKSSASFMNVFKGLLKMGIIPTRKTYEIILGRTISKKDFDIMIEIIDLMSNAGFKLSIESTIGVHIMFITLINESKFEFKYFLEKTILLRQKISFVIIGDRASDVFINRLYSSLLKLASNFDEVTPLFDLILKDNIKYNSWTQIYIIKPLDKLANLESQKAQLDIFKNQLRYRKGS